MISRAFVYGSVFGAVIASSINMYADYQDRQELEGDMYDHVVQNECFRDGDPYGRQEFTYVTKDGTRHTSKLDHCSIDKERERLGLKEYEAPVIHENEES